MMTPLTAPKCRSLLVVRCIVVLRSAARESQFGVRTAIKTRQSPAVLEPVPPIITNERGDVNVFGSIGEAEAYVEPIDIENDEYEFYDATGLVLRGEVHTIRERGGTVHRLFHPS
jgi:hypothetical protein